MNHFDIPRLSTLINCIIKLQSQKNPLTIQNIANNLDYPIEIVRGDVYSLLNFTHIDELLYFRDEKINNLFCSSKEKKTNSAFYNSLIEGIYDEQELKVILNVDFGCPTIGYPVKLTDLEFDFLARTKTDNNGLISIKYTSHALSEDILSLQSKLQECIDNINGRQHINLRYCGVNKKNSDFIEDICPDRLYHNTTDNILYLLSYNAEKDRIQVFRLDRIRSCHTIDKYSSTPISEKIEQVKTRWGMDMNDSTPCHVKLRIKNHTSNIIHKIKYETQEHDCKLYPSKDNHSIWYYEENVLGMNSFRSWLRSYGSSITVLEPQELADAMRDSAKRQLENYATLEDSFS